MATVTLLQAKSAFWGFQGLLWAGTATGGSATKITDSAFRNLTGDMWPFPIRGRQVRITSGSASGDLRILVDSDPTEGDLFPNADFSAAVASTNTYEIWGNSIHGGSTLTDLFNTVLRKLRPITQTRLDVERFQGVYSFTASVDTPRDIIEVYERRMNYDVGGNYTPVPVAWWRPFRLAGAGTPTVHLHLPSPRIFATTQLNGSHNSSITTLTVDATADAPSPDIDFPSSGRLVVENELIDYTGTTATTFTGCTRGAGNSVAATHADNTVVDLATGVYYFVEHSATFTAFASDSSTIDAIYQDWVVWEAILAHARTMLVKAPESDKPRWRELRKLALDELLVYRPRFIPRRPVRPMSSEEPLTFGYSDTVSG